MLPIRLAPQDDDLQGLSGARVASGSRSDVSYAIGAALGGGSMGVVFDATRFSARGQIPVVLKVLRPWFTRQAGATAGTSIRKEAESLERLNKQNPPTPFVVRLLDVGSVPVVHGDVLIDLPYLALEHVHGGAEGTTLLERVRSSVRATGYAFDPGRAALAIECLVSGLGAIHDVKIIHRDLKPENILCCGFGSEEIFKISDFGIARPTGLAATFGGLLVGTPGYAAPEQAALDPERIGAWTDVFALAATLFHLLTGDDYFGEVGVADVIAVVRNPARRRLVDSPGLSPDLRSEPAACAAIDAVLARATSSRIEDRPQTAQQLGALLLPWVRPDSKRYRGTLQSRVTSAVESETRFVGRSWSIRNAPGEDRIVRSVAWNSDGRCLAVTSHGLEVWNGTGWRVLDLKGVEPESLRFVRQISPGQWLIGGTGCMLGVFHSSGKVSVVPGQSPDSTVEHADGDIDDLAVLVVTSPEKPPTLYAMAGQRWVRPYPLNGVSLVSAIRRLDDTRWLVTGRNTNGEGFASIYEPLYFQVTPLPHPKARAFLAAGSNPDRGLAVVGGTDGAIAYVEQGQVMMESLSEGLAVTTVGIDVAGRAWAAALGRVYLRQPAQNDRWTCVWRDPTWRVPMVSLYADIGILTVMTADGGILEGRVRMG